MIRLGFSMIIGCLARRLIYDPGTQSAAKNIVEILIY